MPTTMQPTRTASRRFRTLIPTLRRLVRCISCGTIKKERSYALCSECYKLNGRLALGLFVHVARHAERATPQYSYRRHPEFEKTCRIYERRRQSAHTIAAIDNAIPQYRPSNADPRNRCEREEYDGLAAYELGDLLDWQVYGIELPEPERSTHRELTDAEIAR